MSEEFPESQPPEEAPTEAPPEEPTPEPEPEPEPEAPAEEPLTTEEPPADDGQEVPAEEEEGTAGEPEGEAGAGETLVDPGARARSEVARVYPGNDAALAYAEALLGAEDPAACEASEDLSYDDARTVSEIVFGVRPVDAVTGEPVGAYHG